MDDEEEFSYYWVPEDPLPTVEPPPEQSPVTVTALPGPSSPIHATIGEVQPGNLFPYIIIAGVIGIVAYMVLVKPPPRGFWNWLF